MTLTAPVRNGLKGEVRRFRKSAWPPECVEDGVDDFHGQNISEYRIDWQADIYPNRVDAKRMATMQNIRMADSFFDPERVRTEMAKRGISQTEMAKVLGLPSQSAFSNILTGKRAVKVHEAETIYRYLGLAMAKESTGLFQVPIIGFSGAGQWREAVEVPLGWFPVPPAVAGPKSFSVQVSGDSMDQVLPDGSYAVVDPDQRELRDGKCYLLQNGDHEVTIKCYRRNPSRFVPLSNNDTHQEFLVSDHDLVILGRIVWHGAPL